MRTTNCLNAKETLARKARERGGFKTLVVRRMNKVKNRRRRKQPFAPASHLFHSSHTSEQCCQRNESRAADRIASRSSVVLQPAR